MLHAVWSGTERQRQREREREKTKRNQLECKVQVVLQHLQACKEKKETCRGGGGERGREREEKSFRGWFVVVVIDCGLIVLFFRQWRP